MTDSGPSWLRLRQIALVAEKLAPVEEELAFVLGIEVCFRDPGVGHFGLENALFPIGNQLLEVVAPTRENTAGGRYLERRGGDGGYMVITQCNDHAPRRARVKDLGIRVVNQYDSDEFRNMQLHPKDTGGSFFEIDEMVGPGAHEPDGPWEPAGKDWQRARRLERVSIRRRYAPRDRARLPERCGGGSPPGSFSPNTKEVLNMTDQQVGKWSAWISFVLCLAAGLWILIFAGFDPDDPLVSGIGLYFVGKAFYVGPSLLLDSKRRASD